MIRPISCSAGRKILFQYARLRSSTEPVTTRDTTAPAAAAMLDMFASGLVSDSISL